MAVTNLILTALATNLFKDTSGTKTAVTVKGSSGIIYAIYVDNHLNAAEAEYLKIYNSAGAITVGTTVPDMVIMIPAAYVGPILIAPLGITFGIGVQTAVVTTGGTAGTTAPTAAIEIDIVYT